MPESEPSPLVVTQHASTLFSAPSADGVVHATVDAAGSTATRTPGVEDLESRAYTGDKGLTLIEFAPFAVVAAITPSTDVGNLTRMGRRMQRSIYVKSAPTRATPPCPSAPRPETASPSLRISCGPCSAAWSAIFGSRKERPSRKPTMTGTAR